MTEAPMSEPGEIAGWPKLVVTYGTDPANIAPLLPPGIEPLEPTVTIAFYCVPVLGEPEYGVSVKVAAGWQGVAGQYSLGLGIDQESAVHISAETNGQPKFLCDITFFRLGDAVTARATHQGYTFVEFTGTSAGAIEPRTGEFTEHEWWTKYSRAIGGAPNQYDFAPHVVDVCTAFEPRHLEAVDGSLLLRDSPWDPIARLLPVTTATTAHLVTNTPKARSLTNAGPLDPDAFWPHVDVISGSRWPGERGGPRPS
ncbi:acetoacetate decarboxylase family protein [Aquihabitans sp. McL0605]|uniref:acetoacetate decarboxylase family protein n=1 Tax=Aquihabitans sp. McL0605 TaxID=3415671 RepID=UPI003CE8CC00